MSANSSSINPPPFDSSSRCDIAVSSDGSAARVDDGEAPAAAVKPSAPRSGEGEGDYQMSANESVSSIAAAHWTVPGTQSSGQMYDVHELSPRLSPIVPGCRVPVHCTVPVLNHPVKLYDVHELSPFVPVCPRLSPIVPDCPRLSPIVPDCPSGHFTGGGSSGQFTGFPVTI
jgi:hypothetical protein